MGSFPASYDYQTPVPVPQDAVASGPPITVSQEAAKTQAVLGQQIEGLSQEVDRYGLHIDTMSAQQALNKLRATKDDLTFGAENGFMNVKGLDVLKKGDDGTSFMDGAKSRFQIAQDAIGSGLSPRAMMMFQNKAEEEKSAYGVELARHSIQQTEVANKSIFTDTTNQTLTAAARHSGDPVMLDTLAARAKTAAANYATQAGLKPDALMTAAESNVYRTGIESRIQQNDPQGAIALFHRYADKLDAKDRLETERLVKTVEIGEVARGFVAGSPGTATGGGYDNNTGNISATKIQYAGKGAPQGNFETFLSPEHGVAAAYGTMVAKAKQNGGSITFAEMIGGNSRVQGWAAAPVTAADQANPMLKGNDPMAYATTLARSVGLGPNDPVPIGDKAKMAQILKAQNVLEKGRQTVGDEMYGRGIQLASGDTSVMPTLTPQVQPSADALQRSVDAATPPTPSPANTERAGPPGFLDTRQLKIDLDQWRIGKMAENQKLYGANPAQLSANQQLIEQQYGLREKGIELAKETLYKAVEDWVTKGGPGGGPAIERPPPEIWNQLTYEKQRSIDATLTHNAKQQDPPFTPDAKRLWLKLSDMATNEPDQFKNFDMTQLIPIMPKDRLEQLQGLKDGIQKGGQKEYDSSKALSMADRSLGLMGVDIRASGASDQDVALRQQMHSQLLDWLQRFQIENKRAPKDSEVRQQVDNMLIEGRTERPGWWARNIGTWSAEKQAVGPPNAKGASGERGSTAHSKFLFTVPQADLDKFYVPYKTIPADRRTLIEQKIAPQLQGLDDAAKQDLVEQTYLRALMKQRGQ